MDLADRLVEAQYEVTDRLTQFLCGKRPGNACLIYYEENTIKRQGAKYPGYYALSAIFAI